MSSFNVDLNLIKIDFDNNKHSLNLFVFSLSSVGSVLACLPHSLHCQVAAVSERQLSVSNVQTGVEVEGRLIRCLPLLFWEFVKCFQYTRSERWKYKSLVKCNCLSWLDSLINKLEKLLKVISWLFYNFIFNTRHNKTELISNKAIAMMHGKSLNSILGKWKSKLFPLFCI